MPLTATANRHRISTIYVGMHMSSLHKECAEIWTPVIIKTFLCELMFDYINMMSLNRYLYTKIKKEVKVRCGQ